MRHSLWTTFIGLLASFSFAAAAVAGKTPSGKSSSHARPKIDIDSAELDTTTIHSLYVDGEFEPAIKQLETARKNGQLKTHRDSVFAYKHLGVMYAASYETMEKGKQFMYQLLTIEPSVLIMDMYASDMIYMIFRNVQTEFEIRHARPTLVLADSTAQKDLHPTTSQPKILGRSTWPYWTGAIVLAAGVGATGYFIMKGSPSKSIHYDGGL